VPPQTGLLGRGDHRKAAYPRRLGSLPLGGTTIPQTMSPIDGSSKGRDGLGGAELRTGRRGKGDDAACPRLFVAAPRDDL
jgi:hypothetical protein